MPLLALSTLGDDRPGVIAAVSAVLLRAGCNIEESAMTRLRGEFAMMLVLDSPLSPDDLHAELGDVAAELGLVVSVRPASAPLSDEGDRLFTVSVYGADHPGIVHSVTSLLARHDVNVIDVVTHVVESGDQQVYVMALEVTMPATTDEPAVAAALAGLASTQGVQASLSPVDSETL